MRRTLLIGLVALGAWCQKPPANPAKDVRETIHGVEITDHYRWLEDQNSPETRAWIDAQNAYTESVIGKLPDRERLRRRLTELMKIDQTGVPRKRGDRYFFSRRLAGQDQAVLYFRQGLNGKDQVLVDPNPLSADHTTWATLLDVSRDGKLAAYGLRRGGEDEVAVKLLDVDTLKELPDALPRGRYGVSIKPDKSGFYYSKYTQEGTRIFYHALGKPIAEDRLVFGEGYSPEMGIDARVSADGRYLLVQVFHGSAADRTETWVQDLLKGTPIAPVVKDIAARFAGTICGDRLFLQTNWNAPNGRILAIDLRNPSPSRWQTVVPAGSDAIEDFEAVGGRLFVEYLHNASSRVAIFMPDGRPAGDLPLPQTLGTFGQFSGEWDDREAFFEFNSFNLPSSIYHYDVASGREEIWWRSSAPVDPEKLSVEQVWYGSKDGTKIPMFLVHRKDLKPDRNTPVYLTGYGGFTVSLTPHFSPTPVVWAENGGLYALPNLRGGGEFGEKWHQAGMLAHKQNVFDDFISAAEWLVEKGYTSPAKLAIEGASNGGLLVGAALTQRPDLFAAVVCGYPLLDMLRYHKFLVARWWVPEYGSADDPAQFRYLYAYSPYQHVKKGVKYPAVLFVTGDSDTRVAPLHARKMAALLQASTASDRPVLLHYDTKAGHSRGLPVTRQIDNLVDELAFLDWQLSR